MSKKWNLIAFTILLLGQIILGPMGIWTVSAETTGLPVAELADTPVIEYVDEITALKGEPTEGNEKAPESSDVVDEGEGADAPQMNSPTPTEEAAEEDGEDPESSVDESSNLSEEGNTDTDALGKKRNPWGGTVTVTKKDQRGNPVPGITFILKHPGQYTKSATTDDNGVAKFTNLHNGNHWLTEQTPKGYEVCSGIPEKIVIADKHSGKKHHSIEVVNAKIGHCQDTGDGKINLTKQFEGLQENLPSATFQLTGHDYTATVSTGPNGFASFSNLDFGTYILKEIQAPEGYTLADEYAEGVEIVINENSKTVNLSPIMNYKKKTNDNVILTKIDQETEAPLANAQFKLYVKHSKGWKQINGIYTTNEVGQIAVHLKKGEYQFVEVVAPEGYEIDGKGEYKFSIPKKVNEIVYLTVPNKKKQESVVLTKVDADHPEITLPGAIFELWKYEKGKKGGKWNSQGSYTTDEAGKIKLTLPKGTYKFIETNPPAGYELSGKSEATFFVEGGKTKYLQVENKKVVLGKIVITKVDALVPILPLKGATFKLFKGDAEVATGTTDHKGQLILKDLPLGTYTLVETKAPNGYELDATPTTITLSSDQPTKVVTVKNKKSATVTLYKYKDGTTTPLAGAKFDLQVNIPFKGYVKVSSHVTDANGQINIPFLLPGSYQFVETEAPIGYEMNEDNQYPFTIKFKSKKTEMVTVYNKATDEETVSIFKIVKVDSANPAVKLPNAVFKLQQKIDEVYVDVEGYSTITTGSTGESEELELAPGDYQLVETQAPTGYVGVGNVTSFTIDHELDEVKVITITNRRQSTGGGGGTTPTPTPTPDPDPEDPGEEVPEEPQPEDPGEEVPEEPQPEEPGEEVPEEPQPEDPGVEAPEEPQPEEPAEVVPPTAQPENPKPETVMGKVLPRTGEGFSLDLMVAGLATLVVGSWFLFGRKRRRNHSDV